MTSDPETSRVRDAGSTRANPWWLVQGPSIASEFKVQAAAWRETVDRVDAG
jgi:hypothetical protein